MNHRRPRPRPTDLLVAAQGLALAVVVWPGRGRWRLPAPVAAVAAGGLVAGSALAVAGLSGLGPDLTAFVEPRAGAALRTDGPFAVSRNPVYAGLLVAGAGLAVLRRRPAPLVGWAGLAAVLHVKTGIEEVRLRARFGPEYDAYAARTARLLGIARRQR